MVGRALGGEWSYATLGANVTNFTETGLAAGTTYTYRVYAGNLVSTTPVVEVSLTTLGAISGDIVIRSVERTAGGLRLDLAGSIGQRFVVEGTEDFATWRAVTETLTHDSEMKVDVAVGTEAKMFYRTRRVE